MFNQEYLLLYNETLRSLLFTSMYQISSNFGRPLKKCKNKENKKNKEKTSKPKQQEHTIVRLKWSEIEKMTIDELEIYLNHNFKINQQ